MNRYLANFLSLEKISWNLIYCLRRFVKIGRISTSLRKRLENDFGRKMLAPRGTRVVVSLTTRGGEGGGNYAFYFSQSTRNTKLHCSSTKMNLHRFPWQL